MYIAGFPSCDDVYIYMCIYQSDGTRCEDGWYGYEGQCYYFNIEKLDYKNASVACHMMDAQLASYGTVSDALVPITIKNTPIYKNVGHYWIGFYDTYGVLAIHYH